MVQRGNHYALVDEADNIFFDEARTPLVISSATRLALPEEQVVYRWADQLAPELARGRHFTFGEKKGKIELTQHGKQTIRWSNPPCGPHSRAMDKLFEHVGRGLHAHYRFHRDQPYLVDNEKVVIIDELTSRRMPDRHSSDGLHQAVEAKEGVSITVAAKHAAQSTFQSPR